eukprot:g5030.t1
MLTLTKFTIRNNHTMFNRLSFVETKNGDSIKLNRGEKNVYLPTPSKPSNDTNASLNLPICKGIFYALGSKFGQKPYVNPIVNGDVVISSSSVLEGDVNEILEYPVTKHNYFETEEEPNAFVMIEFLKSEVFLSSLVLAYPPLKHCDHIPINLRIESSNDATHWQTLGTYREIEDIIKWPHVVNCAIDNFILVDKKNDDIELNNEQSLFSTIAINTNDNAYYKYVRVVHLGKTFPTNSNFFVLSGIEMFGVVRDQKTPIIKHIPNSSILRNNGSEVTIFDRQITEIIVLISKHAITASSQLSNCDKCINIFDVKNIPITVIDSSATESIDDRDILFKISNTRVYPQIFKKVGYKNTTDNKNNVDRNNLLYFGNFEQLQEVVDNEEIAYDLRKKFPNIETFEDLFGHLRILENSLIY